MEEKCGNCKYYKEEVCKRYPPDIEMESIWPDDRSYEARSSWVFPIVKEGEWCGEWKKDDK